MVCLFSRLDREHIEVFSNCNGFGVVSLLMQSEAREEVKVLSSKSSKEHAKILKGIGRMVQIVKEDLDGGNEEMGLAYKRIVVVEETRNYLRVMSGRAIGIGSKKEIEELGREVKELISREEEIWDRQKKAMREKEEREREGEREGEQRG